MGVIRKTKSVQTLLKAFEQTDNAISATELVEQLSHEMNKTTVYRILDRLESDGTLHSFIGKNGSKWYAKCLPKSSSNQVDTHPHFQCRDCGKTFCLPIDIAIPPVPNCKIDSAEILLIGQCNDCLS